MNNPKITVLMSVYNGEKYVREALESILKQTFRNFEFIIINDGSTDNSKKILEECANKDERIKLINNIANLGLTKSLNVGLKEARGEYIARLDADDVARPERLQKQFYFLESNRNIVLVGAWANIIDENGKILRVKKLPEEPEIIKFHLMFERSPFFHSAIFFRKDIVLKEGRYNDDFARAQDFELYLRLAKKYKLANIAEPLIKYRIHAESVTTKNNDEQYAVYEKVLFSFMENNYGPLEKDDFSKWSAGRHRNNLTYHDLMTAARTEDVLYARYVRWEKPSPQNLVTFKKIHQMNKKMMRKHYWRYRLAFVYNWAGKIKKFYKRAEKIKL